MEPIRFAVLGLGVGALYVLVAHGIVLIYRGSGTLNFAQGALGLVGAYAFYELHLDHGWPWPLALPVALVLSAAAGIVTERAILRRLRHGSAVAGVIATLGVLVLLEALATKRYGDEVRLVPSLLPNRVVEPVAGVTVGLDRILLLGVALVATVVLSLVYRRTRFGLATSAVAENETALASLGRSPGLVAAANWGVGAALAGLAAILVAPITGLSPRELALLVIPGLAAAPVGSFTSFWLTLGGALVIGVAESETIRYVHQPGWGKAIPFLLIIAVLTVRGRALPLRGDRAERGARLGAGGLSATRSVPLLVAAFVVVATLPPDWLDPATTTLLVALTCLSLVVVTGYTGQLSLAQLTLAGVGALAAAHLSRAGLPFLLCVLIATAVTVPVGMLVAVPALRTRGANLAVATLGLAVAIEKLVLGNPAYTGGIGGLSVERPRLLGTDLGASAHPDRYALLVLGAVVLAGLVVVNLRRGRAGRRLVAVRANERAAAALGVGVVGAKLFAFGLGAAIAGLAGAVAAFRFDRADLTPYTLLGSVNLVVEAVIGGIGYAGGAVVGGIAGLGGLGTEALGRLGGLDDWNQVVAGALVLAVLVVHPHGAFDGLVDAARRLGLRARRPEGPLTVAAVEPRPGAVLEARDLTVRFGGVTALGGVSFVARPGEGLGLIGPNGAGKTTLVDAVSGLVGSEGEVLLGEQAVSRWPAHRRARAGLGRTFQSLELFEDLTVRENLRAAADDRGRWAYLTDLVRPRNPPLPPEVVAAVHELGLVDDLDRRPDELSAGRRRLVALTRALAARPTVVLLDEPAAGLDDDETAELGRVVRDLGTRHGLTVVLVEHDVELVAAVCDRVLVLDHGRTLACGPPGEVLTRPAVVAAYLGAAESTADVPVVAAASEAR